MEATVLSHSEPSPELEKKVKSMSMDKLRMERLITKLYSVSCLGTCVQRKCIW